MPRSTMGAPSHTASCNPSVLNRSLVQFYSRRRTRPIQAALEEPHRRLGRSCAWQRRSRISPPVAMAVFTALLDVADFDSVWTQIPGPPGIDLVAAHLRLTSTKAPCPRNIEFLW